MEQNEDNEMLLRQYLLNSLGQEKQRQLEEQFLTDDHRFQELLLAEDELIDQYVSGALNAQERERFEQHFLITPERYQKLNFAKTLRRYIADAAVAPASVSAPITPRLPSRKRSFASFWGAQNSYLRLSFVAFLLLMVVGSSWLILRNWGLQNQSNRNSSHSVFTFVLTPGLTRGTGEIKKIVVSDDVETVQIQLELGETEPLSYRVNIETDEGRSIFQTDELKPEVTDARRVVTVNVPAKLLTPGDYQAKLKRLTAGGELEEIERYYFRVARK